MKYLLAFTFFLLISNGFSQDIERTELVLERVNGFSSNDRIEDIVVDRDLVLFAGKNGVSSYDYTNSSLSQVVDNKNSVSVQLSKNGNIFSAYNNGKLYVNDKFLYHLDQEGLEITDLEIYKGKLWVATSKGIHIFNISSQKYITSYTLSNTKMKSDNVKFIHHYKNLENLWIGTEKGLIEVKGKDKWKISNTKESFIAVTENIDGMWLMSDKELYLVYAEQGRDRWQQQGLSKGLYQGEVNDLALDDKDNLYIASDILIRYNPYKEKLEQYGENLGLVASKCLSLASDDKGVLWLGTEDAGLFRIYEDKMDINQMVITTLLEKPISCTGGSDGSIRVAVQGGLPPYKYLWERFRLKGETNPSKLKAGTYKVTVEDAIGVRQYASIFIEDPEPLEAEVVSTTPVSKAGKKDGQAVIRALGGTAPYSYQWENGGTESKNKKLTYGNNNVLITDSKGCGLQTFVEVGKPKLLPDLDITKVKEGQTLKIDNLYYAANSSELTEESHEVLKEVFDFLNVNDNIFVEIGGHTNDVPSDEFCDKLSTDRAKAVSDFLLDQGIGTDRISYKGYGKRNPIASNKSLRGRQLNQRVEIKILRIEG